MQSNLIKVNTQVQSSRVYENTILSDNPIHYWRFEETSGRTAQATVGSRDGTYWGGYTLGEISAYTNLGNAVRLDGFNNTHIALGTPIHPGNSISVEAWFNLDPSSINTFSPIIARWDGSYELDINNSTNPSLGQGKANMVVSSTTGTPGFAVSNNPVSKGEWHHIVGVFEGVSDGGSGGITIFVDGIQGTTTTIGGNLEDLGGDDGLWYIGRTRSPNSGFAWDGLLDEVAIYNYALTPRQIRSHINAASQNPNIPVPGVLAFNNSNYSVNENNNQATITVDRTEGSDTSVSITVSGTGGTATPNSDYTDNFPITLEFADGETTKTFTIPIIDDDIVEADETINLRLSNPTNGVSLGAISTSVLNIVDNDQTPPPPPGVNLQIANNPITENGNLKLVYTFTRTGNLSQPQTVNFSVGGTSTFGSDYTASGAATFTAAEGSINFAPNSDTAIVNITPKKDNTFEPNETVIIAIAGNSVTGTILNDDGSSENDYLSGSAGNDLFDGKEGNDTMEGKGGNDTYIVDSETDNIIEEANSGTDTVKSSVNHTLAPNVETLILTGTAIIEGTGNSLNNTITGNSGNNLLTGHGGNDILNGGLGADNLIGGEGNDSYTIDSDDTIIEQPDGGIDTVTVTTDYTLGNNLDKLILKGTVSINGTGNNLPNSITGNSGNNILTGHGGNDTLIGGLGNDKFVFNSPNEGINRVQDFVVADDTIILSVSGFTGLTGNPTLAESQFVRGTRATSSEPQIIYNNTNGSLWFDGDGTGTATALQFTTLPRNLSLDNNNFLVS